MLASWVAGCVRAIEYSDPGDERLMRQKESEGSDWPAPLAARLEKDAEAGQIAAAVVAIWLEIDAALHPIIGRQGVAALFNRSLHLTAATFPWLAQDRSAAQPAADPLVLKAALAAQSAVSAAAGGSALLQSFHGLLASLVGPALTEQLLGSIWVHSSGSKPERKASS
jgi:hypothetical protein